jgi:hypothetical protein
MFINVAGGIIKGVGAGGRAGWAVLHFAPSEWYVWVGTPDDRVGISVGVGPIRANATSYFMVGSKILGSPPPPPEVSKILKGVNLDYMKDLNAIGTGGGFAFGAALSVSTGDLNFMMFYGRFDAGAGFDIMLRDYGDIRCAGSSDRMGINGWYANGQAYAYFDGSVGIRVSLFGIKKNIEILSIGAAAVLQAKLPNPFWMRGIVGGYFSVLNGAVKGNCQFQVTLGKECVIVTDPNAILDNVKVIAEVTPANGERQVNVFNTPQALFNLPVDKPFELVDEMAGNVKRSFRVKLDRFELLYENKTVVGTIEWNPNNDVAAFNSYEVLPSKKDVTASVQVVFEELINGAWTPVVTKGQRVTEKLEQVFTTGEAPDYIPHHNIEFSYPVIGQMNFYNQESREGYIKLKKAQPYLFEADAKWRQEGRFKGGDGTVSLFGYNYTYSSNLVDFTIPNLKTGDQYMMEMVNVPAQKAGAVDRNVTEVSNKVVTEGTTLDMEIASKKAEGTIEDLQEKSIFTSRFRSSSYQTFAAKVNSLTTIETFRSLQKAWRVHSLKAYLQFAEPFDLAEIKGSEHTKNIPMIQPVADLSDNVYYNTDIYPVLYEGYPLDGNITIENRTPVSLLGVPPAKAVNIYQDVVNELWLNQSNQDVPIAPTKVRYYYELPISMESDFIEIQTKVANRYLNLTTIPERYERIIWAAYPVIRQGAYKVKLNYFLPGKTTPVSVREIVINNTVGN